MWPRNPVHHIMSTCKKTALTDLETIFTILSSTVNSFIVAGDLNIDLFSNDSYTSTYFNLLSDFYLTQHVEGASHVTDISSTLIDHIVCSSHVFKLRSIQTCGLSNQSTDCEFRLLC